MFPFDNDAEMVSVKKKISVATEDLGRVKTEIKITEMRDNSNGILR